MRITTLLNLQGAGALTPMARCLVPCPSMGQNVGKHCVSSGAGGMGLCGCVPVPVLVHACAHAKGRVITEGPGADLQTFVILLLAEGHPCAQPLHGDHGGQPEEAAQWKHSWKSQWGHSPQQHGGHQDYLLGECGRP